MATSATFHVLIIGAGMVVSAMLVYLVSNQTSRNNRSPCRSRAAESAPVHNHVSNYTKLTKYDQANISCSVFERDSAGSYKTRTREWGMTLHWGANHFEECLPQSLIDRLQSIHVDPYFVPPPGCSDAVPVYNGKTGDLLIEITGDKPNRVSRRKMRMLFAEGLDIQVANHPK